MAKLKSLQSFITATIVASTLSLSALGSVALYAHENHGHSSKMLEQSVSGEHRSAKNKARDQYRHPVETLNFFGFTSEMTVVEITPGG
ncbi:MAG: methyltransferase, partial [Gammaproteobacteria bacterium]